MKRLFLLTIFCLGVVAVGFAQDTVDAVQLKNDGNDALRAKDYKKALELFEKSLANWSEEEQDNAMIYNAGYCAYKVKNFEKAVKYFGQSIENNYKTSTAYLYKANAQRQTGDDDGFVETLEAGMASNPNDMKMKDMLSTFYLKEGNAFYKKGAAILKEAASDVAAGKFTTNDDQYKAATTEAREEFKKALPYFDKALKLTPNDDTAKQLKAAATQAING
ncbi:tetratricopeptide repeat protein [uncultured Sunxiuqinia sp.]|jgi:tetratricopeptide (TPR) repeat protein|uniref:tetratricopeptide repeat protein n=1 Tax=uncultured Sunxiuqinia sp. TaxID=1573825 RepID=UPI0030DB3BD2|tara:strand:+ start:3036 stop:3695 length:660 start_codon:yes stop_codon:yes gene_type:complete